MATPTCTKCHKKTYECPGCKGKGGSHGLFGWLQCGKCKQTGYLCPTHDGHWQR